MQAIGVRGNVRLRCVRNSHRVEAKSWIRIEELKEVALQHTVNLGAGRVESIRLRTYTHRELEEQMEEIYILSERTNVNGSAFNAQPTCSHMHLHGNRADILGAMNVGKYAPVQTKNR